MVVVGYGEEAGTPYWILKNSCEWHTGWGIPRVDKRCCACWVLCWPRFDYGSRAAGVTTHAHVGTATGVGQALLI
jgi:hypothetical protein